MVCAQVNGLGYRSVAVRERRPFGLVNRYNEQPEDVVLAVAITPSSLDASVDLSGSQYGGANATLSKITIDWGDGQIDELNVGDDGEVHTRNTYAGAGTYDIVVTITNEFGFCDSYAESVAVPA